MSPLVYLDTQDYSNFGDVLRGVGDPQHAKVFNELRQLKNEGRVRFVYSMPILSELLQFDSIEEEVSVAKARAVETLCDGFALADPPRVIAYEVAKTAFDLGISNFDPPYDLLSSDNEWYPDVGDALEDFREKMEAEVSRSKERFGSLPRAQRRLLNKKLNTQTLMAAMDQAIPEFARTYGFSPKEVKNSLGLLIKGKISSSEASKRLFAAVQRPTSFIEVYFKRWDGEKTLPDIIRGPGARLRQVLETLQTKLAVLPAEEVKANLPRFMNGWEKQLSRVVLERAKSETPDYQLNEQAYESILAMSDGPESVPVCRNLGILMSRYAAQVVGLTGPPARVEGSFAGDLTHSMYLRHVDIWRADRRFGEIIRQAKVGGKTVLVTRLSHLPDAITSWENTQA